MHIHHKYIIGLIGVLGILLSLYVLSSRPSERDTENPPQGQSQNKNNADTIERLKTYSGSETSWGSSPFSSGEPLTGSTESQFTFQKPDTEWKTRTISGVTYVFGEGNPSEVALTEVRREEILKACEYSEGSIEYIKRDECDAESGVPLEVTKEVEKYLLLALSDPNWAPLAVQCEKNFRAREAPGMDPESLTYDKVFHSNYLDIENFITINPQTGRKVLSNKAYNLAIFLSVATRNGYRLETENPYGDCVDTYAIPIIRNFLTTFYLYRGVPKSALEGTGGLLSGNWDFSQFR